MYNTHCLICGHQKPTKQIFSQSVNISNLISHDFTARKTHTKSHYRVVQCTTCGLIRSNPILEEDIIKQLYIKSDFSYTEIAPFLVKTYMKYGNAILKKLPPSAKILDVGCGNGFFLEALWSQGYHTLLGCEPSLDGISCAAPHIRPLIMQKIFNEDIAITHEGTFDLIVFFHVLDHIIKPDIFLQLCRKALKPGGFIYGVTHNINSPIHRLFRESSVAYDIQHIYLFSKKTIHKLLTLSGYENISIYPIANTFPLKHLIRMSPLPRSIKHLLDLLPLQMLPVTLPVGNMAFIAQKKN